MKAFIDGDIIVYEAGSAADYRYYSVDNREFPLISDARQYVEETYGIPSTGKDEDGISNKAKQNNFIKSCRDPSPLHYSLGNAKQLLGNIMQSCGAEKGTVYLTSTDHSNYRYARATVKPYKGQRSDDGKPYWYKEIREYLISKWGAIVVHGREADDALGCEQWGAYSIGDTQTIICTKDKDLDMIPGWHYNWTRDDAYNIEEGKAWFNFYYQLLIGDQGDNIPGCPGVSTRNPFALELKNAEGVCDRPMVEQTILDHYREKVKDGSPEERMMEMADLLWIQREDGVLWEPVIEALQCERQRTTPAAVGSQDAEGEVQVARG